jgi:hypothetical protein
VTRFLSLSLLAILTDRLKIQDPGRGSQTTLPVTTSPFLPFPVLSSCPLLLFYPPSNPFPFLSYPIVPRRSSLLVIPLSTFFLRLSNALMTVLHLLLLLLLLLFLLLLLLLLLLLPLCRSKYHLYHRVCIANR